MNTRKIGLPVAVVGIIVGLIVSVYGAYQLATVDLNFTVREELEVGGFLDGVLVEGVMDVDFEDAEPGSTYNMALDFYNSGNCDAVVSLTVTKPSTAWIVSFDNNDAVVSVGQWKNGTLSVTVPEGLSPGTYTVSFVTNIEKASTL